MISINRYNCYHKHDYISSIVVPDTITKCEEYISRCLELGHTNYFTTNHGTGGDMFESKTLCDKNGLNVKYGIEAYIVPDAGDRQYSRNHHIIIIPRTNAARQKVHYMNYEANATGYYYRPRIFMDDLLNLFSDDELYITTACEEGLLATKEMEEKVFYPLYEKYNKNIMLEVQPHISERQIALNEKCIKLAKTLKIPIIAANDSHYIYPSDSADRDLFLKGKKVFYEQDGNERYILDYPDYDTFGERFIEQGVLSKKEIIDAIDQTLIFDECENIDIDKSIKMPTIYPDLSYEEKVNELKNILNSKFKDVMADDNISVKKSLEYADEIKNREMKVIEDTEAVRSADYFLVNNKICEVAVNKYNGTLTRTGRGSCGAFLINKILGITQIDRLATTLPIYPERFMSTERLLENRAMPDIDYNIAAQEPFVKATKELLGEYGCMPMIAYGTLQESEAFRNICRAKEIPYSDYNKVAKDIENIKDDEWTDILEIAARHKGAITSASPHPCAHVLSNSDLRYEMDVFRIGDMICAMITSDEADEYKYLKNDYLIVTVWEIIADTFKRIGRPIPTIKELLESLDEEVWKLFDDGITATLNQIDGEWATNLIKQYKPRSMEELAMFVACIRPSFESFRNDFINHRRYTTGSDEMDEIFKNTNNYILFQENLMQYFEWLGVSPSESIGLIKKISKKKIKTSDFDDLTIRLKENWIKNTGSEYGFEEGWEKMQSMMKYGFNTPHAAAYALDCLYGAYLKRNYPLQYYTEVLNIYSKSDTKTENLINELEYFNIKLNFVKFRYSTDIYQEDPETNSIYMGVTSIKSLNAAAAREIYTLRDNEYSNFIELLDDLSQLSFVKKNHIETLIEVDFFSEFGEINQLKEQFEIYSKYHKSTVFKKEDLMNRGITERELNEIPGIRITAKQVRNVEPKEIINLVLKHTSFKETLMLDKIKYEYKNLGYIYTVNDKIPECCVIVSDINSKYKNKIVTLRKLNSKESFVAKIKSAVWKNTPLEEGNIIKITQINEEKKWVKVGEEFKQIDEYEKILKSWEYLG